MGTERRTEEGCRGALASPSHGSRPAKSLLPTEEESLSGSEHSAESRSVSDGSRNVGSPSILPPSHALDDLRLAHVVVKSWIELRRPGKRHRAISSRTASSYSPKDRRRPSLATAPGSATRGYPPPMLLHLRLLAVCLTAVAAVLAATPAGTAGNPNKKTVRGMFTVTVAGDIAVSDHSFTVYVPGTCTRLKTQISGFEVYAPRAFVANGIVFKLSILLLPKDVDGSYNPNQADFTFEAGQEDYSVGAGYPPQAGDLTISRHGRHGIFHFGNDYPERRLPRRDRLVQLSLAVARHQQPPAVLPRHRDG